MQKDLRVQDVVARVAGINLKSVVRVLRALELFAIATGNETLRAELVRLLKAGAWNGGEPAALDAKPTERAVQACGEVFDTVLSRQGWDRVRALQTLQGCPYYGLAVTDKEFSE